MKKVLLVVFCFFLVACGFQLRGQANTAIRNALYIIPRRASYRYRSRRLVKAGTNTRIVDKPKDAQAILEIISVTNDKQIMSVSGGGRVREFELLLSGFISPHRC